MPTTSKKRRSNWRIPPKLNAKVSRHTINEQKVFITDKETGGELVSRWMVNLQKRRTTTGEGTTFGLATGSSPVLVYENLVKAYNNGDFTTENLNTINLDEYANLEAGHKETYKQFMKKNLFDDIKLPESQFHIFGSNPHSNDEEDEEIQRINELLKTYPRHLQLLGIGPNGHIGFNEPGKTLTVDTGARVVKLAIATCEANSRFFDNDINAVPTHARTLGIADILAADSIVILAWGEAKARAIQKAITGPVDSLLPASFLQRHKNVAWVIDKEAASILFGKGMRITRSMARMNLYLQKQIPQANQ
ncbi:glucosamine-6-phosphate deaminase [Parendozoicomonas sp. Alg238-R29]|uniref:glucosamine-6-phosphate deaminase n=1 Tax=Parendozoicomonas sp. Alg238-R29 TaxID=2993446 RepID=UPI00248F0ED2|nr:glucosamine-6-phosphate deaminase [Parendozoicomonas sp. Alg238-R29]